MHVGPPEDEEVEMEALLQQQEVGRIKKRGGVFEAKVEAGDIVNATWVGCVGAVSSSVR